VADDRVKILERTTAHDGFFRLRRYRLRHTLFGGGWSSEISREVFERGPCAAVLLYDPQRDAVVLVEQFRLPAHLAGYASWQIEVVAGILEPDEAPEALVCREAREEAGLEIIGEPIPIHRFMPSPGGSTESVALFCARVDAANAGGIFGLADEHEDIRVVVRSFDEAMALLESDGIENAYTLVALYWLARHRDELRRRWREA
jgi:ADP-ribose pyrophosphatase